VVAGSRIRTALGSRSWVGDCPWRVWEAVPCGLSPRRGASRPSVSRGSSANIPRQAGLLADGFEARGLACAAPAFPRPVVRASVAFVERLADHSGGTAPDSHRTSLLGPEGRLTRLL